MFSICMDPYVVNLQTVFFLVFEYIWNTNSKYKSKDIQSCKQNTVGEKTGLLW